MQVHGRASETERVWVSNDRLAILNSLKIQSIPYGNRRGENGHTLTKFNNLKLHSLYLQN